MDRKPTDKEVNGGSEKKEESGKSIQAQDEAESLATQGQPKGVAPACDLVWVDGKFVLECDSEADGMMALDLLQHARIKLGRRNEGNDNAAKTDEEQPQPNKDEATP